MGKVLSVCIPTYNRIKFLEPTLTAVVKALLPFKDEVELWVSDNCSEVSCETVVREIEKKHGLQINFVRQKENIGLEPNVKFLIENSSGDYIHILGDDDRPVQWFYAIFMPYMRTRKYGMICNQVVSADVADTELRMKTVPFGDVINELPPDEFLEKSIFIHGLLSSVIISREAWNAAPLDYEPRYFIYQTLARECHGVLNLGRPCIWAPVPMLIQHVNYTTFENVVYDSVIPGRLNIYKDVSQYAPKLYEAYNNGILTWRPFWFILYNRGHYRKTKKYYFEHFKLSDRIWLLFWLYVPAPMIAKAVVMPFYNLANYFKIRIKLLFNRFSGRR